MKLDKLLDDVLALIADNPGWFGRKLAIQELETELRASENAVDAARDCGYSTGWDAAVDDMRRDILNEGHAIERANVTRYLRLDSHDGKYLELAKSIEANDHGYRPKPSASLVDSMSAVRR